MKPTYKSFLEKFTGVEFNQINELSLTKQQGFQLTEISDLNEHSTKLLFLIKLDMSDNCISKLVLSKFVNLKWLNASHNIITECLLSLHKLTYLNLSFNMIDTFPDLTKLRNLVTLNLSKNTIRQIRENDLEPVKASLIELDLSFNKIEFTVIDFINFIERLKLFIIKDLAIQGNDFIEKNTCLLKTYKTFIYATLEHLDKINGETLSIERVLLKQNEIKQQMLFENSEATKQNMTVYKKFSDKYKDVKGLSNITQLVLTSKNNFILSSIDDLNIRSTYLTKLLYLDLNGNLLENVELKELISLTQIDLSWNIIKTARFVDLPTLKEIKMDNNHLCDIPLLTDCPLVSLINLDRNNISKVGYSNILSANESLRGLCLRENNVGIEDILSSQLQLFTKLSSIHINHSDKLKEAIRTYLSNHADYVFPTKLKVNDLPFKSGKCLKHKTNKMIQDVIASEREEEDDKSNNSSVKNSNSIEKVSDVLIDMISLLEKLNKLNGNNQIIYIQFLKTANYFFVNESLYHNNNGNDDNNNSSNININNYNNSNKEKELFNNILLEINELMNINPSYTTTLLNITSQFALFQNGLFSQQVFSFYQMLIGTEKNADVLNALKIISNYLMDFQDLTLLEQMINFTQLNENLCCGFHNDNLSLKLIEYLSEDNYLFDITQDENENEIKKTMTIIDLMTKYFLGEHKRFKKEKRERRSKQEEDFDNWIKSNYNNNIGLEIDKDREIGEKHKKNIKASPLRTKNSISYLSDIDIDDNENDKSNNADMNEDNDIESDNQSAISADVEENKFEPNVLFQCQFGKNLTLLESESKFMKNIPNNKNYESVKLLTTYQNALKNEDKEATFNNNFNNTNTSNSEFNYSNNTKPFFKSNLLNKFANAKELKQFHKMKQEIPNFQGLIYAYLFLNAMKSACWILCSLNLNHSLTSKKEYQKKKIMNMLQLFIILCKNYKNCSLSYKELFLNCDYITIKRQFEDFITKLIDNSVETNDVNSKIRNSLLLEAPIKEIVFMKKLIPQIMLGFGSLILMLNQKEFKALISSEFIDKILSITIIERVDPFILTGICKIVHKLLSHPLVPTDDFIFSKIMLKVNTFKNLLNYINPNNAEFNYIVTSVLGDEIDNSQMDFRTITNANLQEMIYSILAIFAKLAKYRLKQFTISSQVEEIINDLQKHCSLYEILSRCLYMPSDIIRKKSIGCFYYFNYPTITDEVILLILDIMKNYSSVTEGKTEYILSIMYLTLNNKLMNMISTNSFSGRDSIISAVRAGVNFLFQNSNRNPKEEEEIKQKNCLTESIILFLITASGYPDLFEDYYFDIIASNEHVFTRVLHNDYLYSFDSKQYIPIELERTFLGNHIMLVFDTINSVYCIQPYSYPFLRLMQKGADVLCNIPDYAINTNQNDQLDSLFYHIENKIIPERKMKRIKEEMLTWYSFQGTNQCFNKKGTKKWFNSKGYTEVNHCKSNNILENSKQKVRIGQLTFEELIIEQRYFIILFPNLLYYLLGQSSGLSKYDIESKLIQKYDETILNSGDILDQYDKYESLGKIKTSFGIVQYFNMEKPFSKPYSQLIYEKLKSKYNDKQSALSMRLESIFHITNMISLKKMNKKRIASLSSSFSSTQILKGDLLHFNLYGLSETNVRKAEEETVDNPHIRSLIISSFLRSCFGIIVSPSKAIRTDFIEIMFIDDKLKQIVLLVDTSLPQYNNSVKLSNLLEKIFQIDHLPIIFNISKYENDENKSSTLKQFEISNKILSSLLIHQIDTPIDFTYERSIFHIFYVICIFYEKEISNYIKNSFKKEKRNDFVICHSLFMFLETFTNCITQLDLKSIDESFLINELLLRIISNKKIEEVMIEMLDQYSLFVNYALSLALVLKKAYPLINNSDDENYEEIEKKYVNTIQLITHFMHKSTISNYRLIRLICLLSKYSPEILHKAIEHFALNDTSTQDNIKLNRINSSNGNKKSNGFSNMDKDALSMGFHPQLIELFCTQTIIVNKISLKEKKLSCNANIIFEETCEYQLIKGNDKQHFTHHDAFAILNMTHLIIFQTKTQNNDIKISNKNCFDVNLLPSESLLKPLIQLSIESINQIVLFEYRNRIIITFDDNRLSFTIKFRHSYISSVFIDKILSIQSRIQIKQSQKLQSKITKKENDLCQSSNHSTKNKSKTPKTQLEYQKYNEFYRKVEEINSLIHQDIHLENTIEENLYQNSKNEKTIANAFYVIINNDHWKIVYISLNCLYVISESFEQQKQIGSNAGLNGKLTERNYSINESDYYQIDHAIFLSQIINYSFDGLSVIMNYQNSKAVLVITFSNHYDLSLFKIQFTSVNKE